MTKSVNKCGETGYGGIVALFTARNLGKT